MNADALPFCASPDLPFRNDRQANMSHAISDFPSTADDVSAAWKEIFEQWPEKMAKRGAIVTTFGEQIPFRSFMLRDNMLLLDRQTPDASGARQIVFPLDRVVAIKFTEVVDERTIKQFGFEGRLGKQ